MYIGLPLAQGRRFLCFFTPQAIPDFPRRSDNWRSGNVGNVKTSRGPIRGPGTGDSSVTGHKMSLTQLC
eukprot:Nitzschia sp. Nitz4//scaffold80_size88189//34405//34827//NITZ4_005085-RA/size88189-snap-gene-0.1-mRNA-1//1//CDS//3329558624//9285//frame0